VKKLLIPFIVGLAIGLGGTTVAVGFLGGESKSLNEALAEATGEGEAHDSLAVATEGEAHADSAGAAEGHEVEGHEVADSTVHLASTEVLDLSDDPASTHAAPVAATEEPVQATTAGEPAMEPARLAKVFASMQAREAARVLEHLDDDEVQIILGQLGNREAAAVLSNLTPERAAVISRAIIRGERSHP
jgi:MgtE intracellular N domain